MKSPLPTTRDIDRMLRFLPVFESEGFEPITEWKGGEVDDGSFQFPYPKYEQDVSAFIDLALQPCWHDHPYNPDQCRDWMETDGFIEDASLPEVITLLTYCVRGDRFCEGFLAEQIRIGKVAAILQRLASLKKKSVL